MRSRSLFFLVGLCTVLASFFMIAGCSSDDPIITDPIDVVDTIDHEQFSGVTEQIDGFVVNTEDILSDALSFALVANDHLDDILFGGQYPLGDSSSTVWTIKFTLGAGAERYGIDSIQFSKNGTPQANGVGADRIDYKHHWYLKNADTTKVHSSFSLQGIDGNTATINGSHLDTTIAHTTVNSVAVRSAYVVNAQFTNWTVVKAGGNWSGACPTSGTATITINATVQVGDAAAVTSSWGFDLTITDGTAAGTLTQGTESVDYSCEVCPAT